MKWVIFDLDDTLADTTHRSEGFDFDNATDEQWDEYFLKCVDDSLIASNVHLLKTLFREAERFRNMYIEIWTGRNAVSIQETVKWLQRHEIRYHFLRMRPVDCRKKNVQLKYDWAKDIGFENIDTVIDDNPKICEMFINNGVNVLQVHKGIKL